ncbi:MAG: hypothetical protein M5U28_01625 [Sandaracinaceae bacterium]|nr:hypothetical protein [Sandaracinaceae bacterium]
MRWLLVWVALLAWPASTAAQRAPAPLRIDTAAVDALLARYAAAIKVGDAAALLAMASTRYHDDAGTPAPDDDIDYAVLREHLQRRASRFQTVDLALSITSLRVEGDRCHVEAAYDARVRIGGRERALRETVRLTLIEENGELRFLSGM